MKLLTTFFLGFFVCGLGFEWKGFHGWLIGLLICLILIALELILELNDASRSDGE